MNVADGLIRRCLLAMIPEPLQFNRDESGIWHWAETAPLKTVIDPRAGVHSWIVVHGTTATIKLDGKTIIYDRIAIGPHGEWICALRMNGDGDRG